MAGHYYVMSAYPFMLIGQGLGLARCTFYDQAQPAGDQAPRQAVMALAAQYPAFGQRRMSSNSSVLPSS